MARNRTRLRWVSAAAAVAVLGGGGTAWGLTRGSGHAYRTAAAVRATVTQTIAATGTVAPVSSANESFQVDGTVAKVAVKAGRRVHAGQVLARLNRSSLRAQLWSAQAALAAARSRLASDQSGRAAASNSNDNSSAVQASRPTVATPSPGPSSTGQGPSGGTPSGGTIAQQQAAVRAAQRATDQALGDASRALAAAQAACESSPSPSSAPSSSPSPEPTASTTPQGGSGSGGTTRDDCTSASAALLAAQQMVDRDEQQVAAAEGGLNQALAALQASLRRQSASNNNTLSNGKGSASNTPTAAAIASDQASIDQARAQVANAAADLDQATLRATITGRVTAVTIHHGDQVSAGSSTPAVEIVGSRQEQANIALSATQIRRVRLGMSARVTLDGSSKALAGRVVAIDAAGTTDSSTGTTTYPVTIALPPNTAVVNGAAAAITLIVESVPDVLTVPTSAVHLNDSRIYVELASGSGEVRRTVTIGAIGPARTQIKSGLVAGQRVVLADYYKAVPSSSSNLNGSGGLLGGSRGGRFLRQFVVDNGGPGGFVRGVG